jgi:hypothetical protein
VTSASERSNRIPECVLGLPALLLPTAVLHTYTTAERRNDALLYNVSFVCFRESILAARGLAE